MPSLTLEEAIAKWVKYNLGVAKDKKACRTRMTAVEEFRDFITSQPEPGETRTPKTRLRDIERTDCGEWCSALLAKRWEAFDKAKGGVVTKQLSLGTVGNKFTWLILFFKWAMRAGHYAKGDNPATGHITVPKKFKKERAKSHGWRPFTQEEVSAIFTPEALGSMRSTSARWLALMSLYTGARSNELARLELADVRIEEGVPLLGLTLVGDDKSLKTDASERVVPIHPDLIALGFLEMVERLRAQKKTKLFPTLTFDAQNGPANAGQRAFSRLLAERLKIVARGESRVGLHSFRDTAIIAMQRAGVREEVRHEYTGHEQSNRGAHADSYGEAFTPKALAAACHPALDFRLDLPGLRRILEQEIESDVE
ncbi:site-specific integrase [Xanthomonas hyacinthi]|uniref:Tyr recombinase domain-containing protein n=1 Tax=Xanthomonas hyacinthi TaxID=56455 RepID=A0A2S7ENN0_9XANT|nr:site-specific integrase [Xanthomonas hyacinthi]PPU93230.1 hypothetical protein XhyaCFBP1156_20770 [Xanthomonas hyacinthi]QGY77821.1 site-specific integrase [Xanthomonas hyacinthi]